MMILLIIDDVGEWTLSFTETGSWPAPLSHFFMKEKHVAEVWESGLEKNAACSVRMRAGALTQLTGIWCMSLLPALSLTWLETRCTAEFTNRQHKDGEEQKQPHPLTWRSACDQSSPFCKNSLKCHRFSRRNLSIARSTRKDKRRRVFLSGFQNNAKLWEKSGITFSAESEVLFLIYFTHWTFYAFIQRGHDSR